MDYLLKELPNNLLFIKWYPAPTQNTQPQGYFVRDLQQRLDKATEPIYFISDLRLGRIMHMPTIQQLGKLTEHEMYGGGVAFSTWDPLSRVFVGKFSRFANNDKGDNVFFETIDQACSRLEEMKEGIVKDVDWESLFNELEGNART